MSLGNFLIMRQELLMVAVVLIVLMAEIFTSHENRKHISTFTALLFALVTIIGFLPSPSGTLFGGMYIASGTTAIMKNVLNIGILLVMIQSITWLRKI